MRGSAEMARDVRCYCYTRSRHSGCIRCIRDSVPVPCKEQRFLLRNPLAMVGPIGEAIALQDNGLNTLGALLLAAGPAVKSQLAPSFRDYLRSL